LKRSTRGIEWYIIYGGSVKWALRYWPKIEIFAHLSRTPWPSGFSRAKRADFLHTGVFKHAEHDGSLGFAVACTQHAVLHALHAAAGQMPELAENSHSGVFAHVEHDENVSFTVACTQRAVLHALHAAAGQVPELDEIAHSGVFAHRESDGMVRFAVASTQHAVLHALHAMQVRSWNWISHSHANWDLALGRELGPRS
jgi:hypothetical protein